MRTKRRPAGFAHSNHGARKSATEISAATVLDEAFANYSDSAPDQPVPNDWRSATRDLIADITAQLETLDSQRRQLARLLKSVETDTIA
jgi:predicted lipoprotein